MNISKILDKEFISSLSGDCYGIVEPFDSDFPEGFSITSFGEPFAYDDCGNIFTIKNYKIFFWDHEIDEIILISNSWEEFISGCTEPEEIELDEDQIISGWVDPEFAKEQGMSNVPSDGWIKKNT